MLYKLIRGIKFIYRKIYSASVAKYVKSAGNNTIVFPDAWIKGGEYIEFGDNFYARSGLRLEAWDRYLENRYFPNIKIGNNVSLGENCHIGAINSIEIGDNVMMGSKIYITDHQHGKTDYEELQKVPIERELYSKSGVKIGDNVWIGDGAVIMPGITVGENSVIGANAVVTKDVPAFSVVGGVPAKVIKCLTGR